VETSYRIFVEYDGGVDIEKDQDIMKAVGYSFDSDGAVLGCDSGCALFGDRTRDQVFYLYDLLAVNAAERNLAKIPGIRVRIERPQ
jgi:hypothetical protein